MLGSHAAAGRRVDRVLAQALDRRPAQGVDRRLGEHEPPVARLAAVRKAKEALAAAGQGALVGRAADVDVDDEACGIAVGEPGGTARAFSDDVALRGRGQHGLEAVRGSRDSARRLSSVSAAGAGPISERPGLEGRACRARARPA